MSTSIDADKAAADKAASDKRIADEAASSAADPANWPTGGYNMLTLILIISMCAVLVVCVDVSTICLVCAYIMNFQYVISTVYIMFMIYSWIKLIENLPIYSALST